MLVLDIETTSQSRALALPYPKEERNPPANYKNPEAIEKWYAKDELDWKAGLAKTAALNPRLGRVVCVGSKLFNNAPVTLANLTESAEAGLVETALSLIQHSTQLITFNGLDFDLPYLHVRAAILGLRIPYAISERLRRYVTRPHADLLAILENWQRPEQGDTLHGWAEAFGLTVTDTSTGADIGALVASGNSEGIHKHCESDVTLTGLLAQRMQSAGLL